MNFYPNTFNFKHVKFFDEETGQDRDWVLSDCPCCETKHSVHFMTYYKFNKHKTKAKLQISEEDFYCTVCGFQGESTKQSPVFKKWMEEEKKQKEQFKRFPDEHYSNLVNTIKSRDQEATQHTF